MHVEFGTEFQKSTVADGDGGREDGGETARFVTGGTKVNNIRRRVLGHVIGSVEVNYGW